MFSNIDRYSGAIVVGVYSLFETFSSSGFGSFLFRVTKYVILLVPPLNFSLLFIKIMKIWVANTSCRYCPSALKAQCEGKFFLGFAY